MAASTSGRGEKTLGGQKKSENKSASRKGKGKENASGSNGGLGQTSTSRSWDNLGSDPSWEWSTITDSSSRKVSPIFTRDGSYFFSFSGASIRIHSVTTGQVVSTLSLPQNSRKDIITCAAINPHNVFQLITGSLNGHIVIWDFLDAIPLQTIDIAQPIYYLCAHSSLRDSVLIAAGRPFHKTEDSGTDDNAVVMRVSLVPQGESTSSSEIRPVGKTRFPTGLIISPDGEWLVAIAGHKVYVASASSRKPSFTKYVSPERLTCLAFHPSEQYFATGDAKGCIRLWHCLNNNTTPQAAKGVEKKTRTTTLHWHAHAVSSLTFTTNGAYLLSGGEEAVLVIWQLHTGKKEFVPRVGAPINAVSVSKAGTNEEEYLLELADATHLFINSGTLRISRSYPRLKIDPTSLGNSPSSTSSKPTPLACHTRSSTLILPSSHPCSLQVYSPSSSKLISELQISPVNRISRREEKPLEPPYVSKIAIAPSEEWLASIDIRDDTDSFKGEIYLKFWSWDESANRWILNTRIDRPHGFKNVTDLAFSQRAGSRNSCMLVTTGEDGCVKVWHLKSSKSRLEGVHEFWLQKSTFEYRSQTPTAVSWSPDCSLLSVAFETCIAVYDSYSSALLTKLTATGGSHSSIKAHFVGHGGRYIATVGGRDLVLWDLVTTSIRWTYKAASTIEQLITHTKSGTFAIFQGSSTTTDGQATKISIFNPNANIPISIKSIPFRIRSAVLCPFLGDAAQYTFVGITHDWSIVVFGNRPRMQRNDGTKASKISVQEKISKGTLFQDIFGKSALTSPPEVISSTPPHFTQSLSPIRVFDTPTHLMPPISTFSDAILQSFLLPRQEKVAGSTSQEQDDNDADMDVDDIPSASAEPYIRQSVSSEEMQTFIKLFKKQSFKVSLPTNDVNRAVIAKHPPSLSKITQDSPVTPTKPSPAPKVVKLSGEHSSPSSPVINGKKRKKL